MKVKSTFDGFVGHAGGEVLLRGGDEFDVDHPLVVARPDLFTAPPAPEPPAEDEPSAPVEPPAPAKRPRQSKQRPGADE